MAQCQVYRTLCIYNEVCGMRVKLGNLYVQSFNIKYLTPEENKPYSIYKDALHFPGVNIGNG